MFGDPCPGTLKYLEAHYQCVKGIHHHHSDPRKSMRKLDFIPFLLVV